MDTSVFSDFTLPNAATWLYFSLLLTVALFFQFSRPLTLRNLDLLTLYLLAPGFLLLQESHALLATAPGHPEYARLQARGWRELVLAYGWLIGASGYWFVRSVADLALVRRPTMTPNLNAPGLGWLGLALFVCLTAVAVRRNHDESEQALVGKRPAPIAQFKDGATAVVRQAQDGAGHTASPDDVRFSVERALAVVGHLAVVVGLLMIGLRHFQDATAGMAMAVLYLLLPYTAFHIGQFHHVWPAALLTWAVYCFRRPYLSGWLLGLAAGTSFFPGLLFPVWVGFYARRGAGRFSIAFLTAVTVSLGLLLLVLSLDGRTPASLLAAMNQADWQPWRSPQAAGQPESLWTGIHWAYRLPVFVLFVAFLAGVAVWPSPKNLSHVIALSAAILLGVQFWYGDRGGVYVLWYLPLLLMMVFRPNLAAHEPPALDPGAGGMLWWAGAAWRRVRHRRANTPVNELAV